MTKKPLTLTATLATAVLIALAAPGVAHALSADHSGTLSNEDGTARFSDPDDQLEALSGANGQPAAPMTFKSGSATMTFTQAQDNSTCTGAPGCGCAACANR